MIMILAWLPPASLIFSCLLWSSEISFNEEGRLMLMIRLL